MGSRPTLYDKVNIMKYSTRNVGKLQVELAEEIESVVEHYN